MKYLLKTSYPCLVKTVSDNYLELEPHDTLEIENEEYLFVYPQNNCQIPFYIDLKNPKESARLSVIQKDFHKILFLEKSKTVKSVQKESISINGKTCYVEIDDEFVVFKTQFKKLKLSYPNHSNNYKLFKITNNACLQFDNDLFVYALSTNKLTRFCGDKIDIENDKITITKNLYDSNNRKKVSTYKISDTIELLEEKFLSEPSKEAQNLLAFKFLEAIKAKDVDCAFKFLSNKLQEHLDKSQLLSFFGNISDFLPLNKVEYIVLNGNKKSYVKFDIANGKIDDINIDEL